MDAASRSLLRDPSLGRPSSGGPPGLSGKSPSATVGVSFSSPGCSGLQLSQYRLERLRQHLRVSSSRSDSDPPATHPRIPRSPGSGGSIGLPGPLVAPPLAAGQRSLTSEDDSVPVLRTRPGLPQVGDLRTLDCLSFTEGPFSLPACGSGRNALAMLSPFLSASAGSRLDGLSSLFAP